MPRCACDAGSSPHHQMTAEFRGHLNWITRDPAACPKCSTTRRARPAIRGPCPMAGGENARVPDGPGQGQFPGCPGVVGQLPALVFPEFSRIPGGWLSRIIRQTSTSRPDQDVTFLVSESRVKDAGDERRPALGPDPAASPVPGASSAARLPASTRRTSRLSGTVAGPLFRSGGHQLDQTLVKTADHLAPALDYGPPVRHFPVAVPAAPFPQTWRPARWTPCPGSGTG